MYFYLPAPLLLLVFLIPSCGSTFPFGITFLVPGELPFTCLIVHVSRWWILSVDGLKTSLFRLSFRRYFSLSIEFQVDRIILPKYVIWNLFIWYGKRLAKKESAPICATTPQMDARNMPDQELNPSLPRECQEPSYLNHHHFCDGVQPVDN